MTGARERLSEHSLVDIPASVLAELTLLSEVLDSPTSDISVTLSGLVAEFSSSLPSFIGFSMLVGDPDDPIEVTTIENAAQAARIRTSLRFPLHDAARPARREVPSGVLIVYAAVPGALVDLAADLAWLSGRALVEARLDEDLAGPGVTSTDGPLSRLSTVNQALGVLMTGGLTPEEASAELDARAVESGGERHHAAAEVLGSISGRNLDPPSDGT